MKLNTRQTLRTMITQCESFIITSAKLFQIAGFKYGNSWAAVSLRVCRTWKFGALFQIYEIYEKSEDALESNQSYGCVWISQLISTHNIINSLTSVRFNGRLCTNQSFLETFLIEPWIELRTYSTGSIPLSLTSVV